MIDLPRESRENQTVNLIVKSTLILLVAAGALSLVGCASAPAGSEPQRGIEGDVAGQDRLWDVHSRTFRELAY